MDAAIAKNRALPDWYVNAPQACPEDSFYLREFSLLSTERQFGMGVGPIPYSKVEARAARLQLDSGNTVAFVRAICAMDSWYLRWLADQQEKTQRANSSGSVSNRRNS